MGVQRVAGGRLSRLFSAYVMRLFTGRGREIPTVPGVQPAVVPRQRQFRRSSCTCSTQRTGWGLGDGGEEMWVETIWVVVCPGLRRSDLRNCPHADERIGENSVRSVGRLCDAFSHLRGNSSRSCGTPPSYSTASVRRA